MNVVTNRLMDLVGIADARRHDGGMDPTLTKNLIFLPLGYSRSRWWHTANSTRWPFCWSAEQLPVFRSKPGKVSVLEGSHAVLPCDVENLGDYTVTWFRVNEKENMLLFADKNRMVNDDRFEVQPDDWHLHIYQTEAYDSGVYSCQVTTEPEMVQLQELDVKVAPMVNLVPDKSLYTVQPGERVQLTCFGSGNPPPKVVWTRKDGLLPNGAERLVGEVLTFDRVSKEHTGVYRCTADNGVKTPAFADITMMTHTTSGDSRTPSVSAPQRFLPVKEGQTVNITCNYNAVPEPQVSWIFNGYPIDLQSDKVKKRMKAVSERAHNGDGHTATLIIYDLLVEDFGNYTCRATNSLGLSEQTIEVIGKPGAPVNVKASVDDSMPDEIKVVWTITSVKPILTYKLAYKQAEEDAFAELELSPDKFDNEPLSDVLTRGSFILKKLRTDQLYKLFVQGRNEYGWGLPSEVASVRTGSPVKREPTGKSTEDEHTGAGGAANVLGAMSLVQTALIVLLGCIVRQGLLQYL